MRQTQGIYLISMVAETLDMHPQTLRKYERAGFVEPLRMGTLRTYSDEDVARLRLIKHFVDDLGLNLAGVEMALSLTRDLLELRKRISNESGVSQATSKSLGQVDQMLAKLGVRVVEQRGSQGDAQESGQRPPWARAHPGESIEFVISR